MKKMPYGYQKIGGLVWMDEVSRIGGGILADDVGLGKTSKFLP
jgi:SNF2 family DNA or RNA helicase